MPNGFDPVGSFVQGFAGGQTMKLQKEEGRRKKAAEDFNREMSIAGINMQLFDDDKMPAAARAKAYSAVSQFVNKYIEGVQLPTTLDASDLEEESIQNMGKQAAHIFDQLEKEKIDRPQALSIFKDLMVDADSIKAQDYFKGKAEMQKFAIEAEDKARPYKIGELVPLSVGGQDIKVPVLDYTEAGQPIFGPAISERPTFKPEAGLGKGPSKEQVTKAENQLKSLTSRYSPALGDKITLMGSTDMMAEIRKNPAVIEGIMNKLKGSPNDLARWENAVGIIDEFLEFEPEEVKDKTKTPEGAEVEDETLEDIWGF